MPSSEKKISVILSIKTKANPRISTDTYVISKFYTLYLGTNINNKKNMTMECHINVSRSILICFVIIVDLMLCPKTRAPQNLIYFFNDKHIFVNILLYFNSTTVKYEGCSFTLRTLGFSPCRAFPAHVDCYLQYLVLGLFGGTA